MSHAGRDGHAVKPFMEHLEDLRATLIRCAVALAIGMGIAFPLTPRILAVLKSPLLVVTRDPNQFLRSLEVVGAFAVSMKIALWAGLLFSGPFILYFVGWFVFPGLKQAEKTVILKVGGLAILLFIFGVWMGYHFALRAALKIMFGMHAWLGIRAEWTVTSYVSFAMQLLIAFGFVFELPAGILVLGKLGIIQSAQLRYYRRHAILAALIIGMLLAPPDVFSQLLMAIPLIILYEVCLWVVWATERRAGRASTVSTSDAGPSR